MFAFGANMHVPSVRRLCPRAAPLGPARAEGWAFRITEHGFASIVRAPGRTVHGLLWGISPVDEVRLDDYEDVDLGLYVKRRIEVVHGGERRRALVYLTANNRPGRPRPGYLDGRVLPAGRAIGLPEEYLAEIEAWQARAGFVPSPYDFW